jgi:hypothetical protein
MPCKLNAGIGDWLADATCYGRAALLAGPPWLDVFCPGCGTSRAIDLRTLDRHPLASVGTLLLGVWCSWCPGSAPMPKLLKLYPLAPARGLISGHRKISSRLCNPDVGHPHGRLSWSLNQ